MDKSINQKQLEDKIEQMVAEMDTEQLSDKVKQDFKDLVCSISALSYSLLETDPSEGLQRRMQLLHQRLKQYEDPTNPQSDLEFQKLIEKHGHSRTSQMWSAVLLLDIINSDQFKTITKYIRFATNHTS